MIWTTRPRSEAGPLAAICRGEGPLVVLIHGVGLRAEAWAGQIEALARTCRVVAVDMPGHGASAALPEDAGLADFTDRVAAAVEAEGAPAVVVGHSFGAMIALDLAIRHADRVAGVAALNAIFRRDAAARAAVMARAGRLDGKTAADPDPTLARWFGAASSPEREACAAWLRAVDPAGYRTAYRVFAREDGPEARGLAALACPALFVTGGREPNSTPAMSEAMAALAPEGRAEVLADAAHMLPMTHAAEVNRLLTAFVARSRNRK